MSRLAYLHKRIVNALGGETEVQRRRREPMRRLVGLLEAREVDTVFDIGANAGQYARELLACGYRGAIVSFEPLADAHAALARASAAHERWEAAPRCAVGERAGEVRIHVSENSQSSSLLPMLERHERAAPRSRYIEEQRVEMITLETALARHAPKHGRLFLKLDVQGYERHILEHSAALLRERFEGFQAEVSLSALYEGEWLFVDLQRFADANGFAPFDIIPAFRDKRTDALLQVDCVFTNERAVLHYAANRS